MIKVITALVFSCACISLQAQESFITTICGNDTAGFSGDSSFAISAKLNFPSGMCLDKFGNIYIADGANHRIRKIDHTTAIITTVAGTGAAGYNGDNIPATNANLLLPEAVFPDSIGNIYVADALNHRIRKINVSTGIISTVAGNGNAGYSGDNGLATDAKLNGPSGLMIDRSGNIYIADYYNHRIRKVDAITGIIVTIAGNGNAGYSGDNGLAIDAEINGPGAVYADDYYNIYFTEIDNSTVRKIAASNGIITTIAGSGLPGYTGDNGPATSATLKQPYGIFIDSVKNIYIAEWSNGVIRKIDGISSIISTVAGCGIQGSSGDGGSATNAKLQPSGVWVDKYGTIFIADLDNHRIRKVYNPQLSVNFLSANNKVSVYPNPANSEITIEYSFYNNEDAVLQITDLTGRIVSTKLLQSKKQREEIDIHAFSLGLYLYRVLQENTLISTGKIIKQ